MLRYDIVKQSCVSGLPNAHYRLLAVSNRLSIMQDEDRKSRFICYRGNDIIKFRSELELTRSEAVRLEQTKIG